MYLLCTYPHSNKIFWLKPQDKYIPGFWTKYTGSYGDLAKIFCLKGLTMMSSIWNCIISILRLLSWFILSNFSSRPNFTCIYPTHSEIPGYTSGCRFFSDLLFPSFVLFWFVRNNRVCLVRSGTTVVRTKRSGALLKCALGCALLKHFASKVWSLQAKCALKIGVCRPSAHLKVPQTDFATCALPKCASRAQNPTFSPYLHTLFSALESYLLFLWCFFIASYCWT
jgi:hypothetical protein